MSESLLPPNATQLERDLEQSMAHIEVVPVEDMKKVWDPTTCPAPLLPWLAWALSVDEWESAWSEAQKREVCRQSYSVHARKGTVGAIRAALAAIGVPVELVEWFQEGGQPGTFRLQTDVPAVGLTQKQQETIYRVALATKNTRSHLARYLVRSASAGALRRGATLASGETLTIFPAEGESGIPPAGGGGGNVLLDTNFPVSAQGLGPGWQYLTAFGGAAADFFCDENGAGRNSTDYPAYYDIGRPMLGTQVRYTVSVHDAADLFGTLYVGMDLNTFSMYFVNFDTDEIIIQKIAGGAQVGNAVVAAYATAGVTFDVSLTEAGLAVSVDEQPVATMADSEYLGNSLIGLMPTMGQRIRSLKVTD